MKFGKFIPSLCLLCETYFYLVIGQTTNKELTDCGKLYKFYDSYDRNDNTCCIFPGIKCDRDGEGYILEANIFINDNCDISTFPYFSRIENLNIVNQNLKEIPNNILNLTTLKNLTLTSNKIQVIPPSIQNLSNLEELNLNDNDIMELPNEIFNLPNLKTLNLSNNPRLNIKMTKFGNSPIENCNFNKINVLCYEPHTCKSVQFNNRVFSDAEAEKEFKKCTSEEIKEIKENIINLNQNNKPLSDDGKNKNNLKQKISPVIIISGITLGFIVLISSSILVTLKYKKRNILVNDEFRTGRPVVLIKNPQNSNNFVMSGIPIINNSNNNQGSFNVQYQPPLYDKFNMNGNSNEMNTFSVVVDGDEPPPEYTDTNKLITKQQFI